MSVKWEVEVYVWGSHTTDLLYAGNSTWKMLRIVIGLMRSGGCNVHVKWSSPK